MLKPQKNTEFLNSCHPVDLNQTLLYTARRCGSQSNCTIVCPTIYQYLGASGI